MFCCIDFDSKISIFIWLITFFLFLFKLLNGSRSRNNLQNSDFMLYKRVTLTERLAKKSKKHELDYRFLITSLDEGVYLKLTHWKNLNARSVKHKSKFSHWILLDEISSKRKSIKSLRAQYATSMNYLISCFFLFKGYVLNRSINCMVLKVEKNIIKQHRKKFDSLLEKRDE